MTIPYLDKEGIARMEKDKKDFGGDRGRVLENAMSLVRAWFPDMSEQEYICLGVLMNGVFEEAVPIVGIGIFKERDRYKFLDNYLGENKPI